MSPDHLDEAVDRALHEIMGADPADDLARRVVHEISAPSSAWRRRSLALAFAACLVLLTLATPRVLREWRSGSPAQLVSAVEMRGGLERAPAAPPSGASEDARGASRQSAGADVPKETASSSARRVTTPNSPIRREGPAESPQVIADARRVEGASVFGSWPAETVAVDQLGPIAPIAVAPVTHAPLRIEEIAIEPLEIEPLRIDPLFPATQQ